MHRTESIEGQTVLSRPMTRRAAVRLLGGVGAAAAAPAFVLTRPERASADYAGLYRTTTALNLRSGPGTNYGVILVMPANALVEDRGQTRNGFRKVAYRGTVGWAHQNFLTVANGGVAFTTTAALNLRAKPSTSGAIKLVVPTGATVIDYDGAPLVNGYRGVDYNGTVGWVYNAYLR